MKRRELIRYGGIGALTLLSSFWLNKSQVVQAQTGGGGGVTVKWLGHSCFLFSGNGMKILVNPFQSLGCVAKYPLPRVQADLVLVSSRLLDEGATEGLPGNPRVIFEPGVYEVNGIKIQSIASPHDREGGRRFGTNLAWRWTQGGVKILHLGGAVAPIEIEQKILMGTPDLALIPVGGGPKSYNPEEAAKAIEVLKPKIVIPTQYLTEAADKNACDLVGVDEFLKLVEGKNITKVNSSQIVVKASNLPKEGTLIRVLKTG
jgi:L-ascorbate metabolism protein UlaG (beta-lactamase superfamily)